MTYTPEQRRAINDRARAKLAEIQQQSQQSKQTKPWGTGAPRRTELEERLERYVSGDRRALDGYDEPEEVTPPRTPPRTLNQGELQVHKEYERHRPTLDSATQALWENFIAAQCEAIINAKFDAFIDIVGSETARSERQFREELRPWREELLADLLKRFSKDFTTMRDDVLNVLHAELGLRGDNVVDLPNPISRKA